MNIVGGAQARDGYEAARAGKPATANPWKPETFGGKAWALGWNAGRLPAPLRWAARFLERPPEEEPEPDPCQARYRGQGGKCPTCGADWWLHAWFCDDFDPIPENPLRCDGCGRIESEHDEPEPA